MKSKKDLLVSIKNTLIKLAQCQVVSLEDKEKLIKLAEQINPPEKKE